jgi:hypothetical protein
MFFGPLDFAIIGNGKRVGRPAHRPPPMKTTINSPRRMRMKAVKRAGMLVLLAAAVVAMTLVLMGQAKPKAFLPGITVADEHPNGCVDCHKNQGAGKDYRLNVSLAVIEDHPKIDAIVKQVPEGCAICHKEGGKVSPLNLMVHKAHYLKGEKSSFVQFYQGACLSCHKLEVASGKMTVKSGAKNW